MSPWPLLADHPELTFNRFLHTLPYHTPSQEATWRFHWDRGSASPVPRAGVFSDTLTLEGGLMLLIDR